MLSPASRVLSALLLCAMVSVGCNRSDTAELTQTKAEAEAARVEAQAARADLAKATAEVATRRNSPALKPPSPSQSDRLLKT